MPFDIPMPPTHPSVIQRVYPDLHAREVARERPSWARLRRMVASRWWRTHPEAAQQFTIARLSAHPTPEGNRELARIVFGGEYECAAVIINGETGGTWRHDVAYGFRYGEHLIYAGIAYGLGQALPGTKMLRYGADAASNPHTQLVWFKAYAEARYGSVCGASAFWSRGRHW